MSLNGDETDIAQHRPRFTSSVIGSIVQEEYGITGTLRPLPSDKDQNFALETGDGTYVVKISHALESRAILEAQHAILRRLAAINLPVQKIVEGNGSTIMAIEDEGGRSHFLRVLTYLEGVPLANVRPHSDDLIRSLGSFLGRLDDGLAELDDPAFHREHPWDLSQAAATIDQLASYLESDSERVLVDHFRRLYSEIVEPRSLRRGLVHGDANDHNVIVNGPESDVRRVVGVIDLGDAVHSWIVGEPAIAAAYAMLDKPDPLDAAATLIGAYHKEHPLTDAELAVVFPLIGLRLSVSLCMSAYQGRLEPDNQYLVISREPALRLLNVWSEIHPRLAEYVFRDACGLDPCPRSNAIVEWLRARRSEIEPIVKADRERCVVFDFGVESSEWTFEELTQPGLASEEIARRISAAGAQAGIGRYDEVRLVYRGDQFTTPMERRTVHLGLDLFQPPGSPVHAPIDGIVHSVADNDRAYDYGPTVILEHRPPNGPTFYTLYGHLSRTSIESLHSGMTIDAGDRIAEMGDIHENGGWAPHLHFQIVADLFDKRNDFPGVAPPGRREVWLRLCPDPQLMVGSIDGARAPRTSAAQLRDSRDRHIGPSLSLSYRVPLQAKRGYMQYLYDADGRRYLDTVNNVAHVGHSNRRVVDAASRAMGVLNTNTRYLYDELTTFARRLAATLPHPLEVCYFVNSGSEANDLALRMARAYTGRHDTLVVDHAYHGNLSSLIEISPYKFNGPGGSGRPPHTHVIPMPDPLRPTVQRSNEFETVRAVSGSLAAFIAESIMSCGGQVFYPEGYLATLYELVRRGGGLTIADEVQTGFGRVGTAFWAFELQGVTPDIVTMGKPMGNGHPLGAVVTTRDIAQSFDNGMEYFNTFGGNPVSCSVGLAVLDVLQEEDLQARAHSVGEHFHRRLRDLKQRHAVIGDVRGMGLFLGVELVREREDNTPATEEAGYVIERMRERGILASVDGPYRNVIKIKPPMVVDESDADLYADVLGDVLTEDFVQARLS